MVLTYTAELSGNTIGVVCTNATPGSPVVSHLRYYLKTGQSVSMSGSVVYAPPNYVPLDTPSGDGVFSFQSYFDFNFQISDIDTVEIIGIDGLEVILTVQNRPTAGAPCFFGNAPVLTPGGYVRMDSLREGDLVSTPGGAAVPIQRVKVYRCAAGPATNPYVIQKGQFGATKRLLISPRHRVATANGMVEAQHLGLPQKERVGVLTYYNLSLPGWANMVVAGVEVESLAPVQRITVPFQAFVALVAKKHGSNLTPALLTKIKSTCRFLENGMVECPVMTNASK